MRRINNANMNCHVIWSLQVLLLSTVLLSAKAQYSTGNAEDGFSSSPTILSNKFGLVSMSAISKGPEKYNNLDLLRKDRYDNKTFIMIRQGNGAALYRFEPGKNPELFGGNLEISSSPVGNQEGTKYRLIYDVAQYDVSKIAFSEFWPDGCIKVFDKTNDQISPLVGNCSNSNGMSNRLNFGDKTLAIEFKIGNPVKLLALEKKRKLIFNDFTDKLLYMYDFDTKLLELFVQSYKLAAPSSMLSSADEATVYVSHNYGVSTIRVGDRKVTLLTGTNTNQGIGSLSTGPFSTANVGALSHLNWIIEDRLMAATNDRALVLLDMVDRNVNVACRAANSTDVVVAGTLESCAFVGPTGMEVTDKYIYTTFKDTAPMYTLQLDRPISCCDGELINEVESGSNPEGEEENTCNDVRFCLDTKFGELQEVDLDIGNFSSMPIDFIVEDRYNPGVFFYNQRTTLRRWVPGHSVTNFLGNAEQEDVNVGFRDGDASEAEFTLISGIVQFNKTKMAIADFQNACVRLYDSVTNNVTTIIGICNNHGSGAKTKSERWDAFSNDEKPFLTPSYSGVVGLCLLEKRNLLLLSDNSYKVIVANDFNTNMSRVLDKNLYVLVPKPSNIIADREEDNIFINHAYGVTRYNMDTGKITKLFGDVDVSLSGTSHIDLIPGPFSVAKTGALDSFSWLIPDQLLLSMGKKFNEVLLVIDLVNDHIYPLCQGNTDLNVTVPGSLDVCKLHSPTGISVTSNGTILVATMNATWEQYNWRRSSFLWSLDTQISKCLPVPSTGLEDFTPVRDSYYIREKATVTCPAGYAIDGPQEIECGSNYTFTTDVPECVELNADEKWEFSPLSGQMAGGTQIMVSGLIPDEGVIIYIGENQTVTDFIKEQNVLNFTMPPSGGRGSVGVVIQFAENVTSSFTYTYLQNPSIVSVLNSTTIASGGFDVVFKVDNINSAHHYVLNTIGHEHECFKEEDKVVCKTAALSDLELTDLYEIPMNLYSEGMQGVFSGQEGNLTVYPDPRFNRASLSLESRKPLVLPGDKLDIGVLNPEYHVQIVSNDGLVINCDLESVGNNTLTCRPDSIEQLKDDIQYNVHIDIGHLNFTDFELGFVAAPGQTWEPTTEPPLDAGEIAAIVICALAASVIVLVVILFLHKKRRAAEKERQLMVERINSIKFEPDSNGDYWAKINVDLKVKLNCFLVKPECLKLKDGQPIGEGNFGKIFLGELHNDGEDHGKQVAVKTLKESHTDMVTLQNFLQEAVILQGYSHPNVISTLAISFPSEELPKVVLPYMANGDLKSLLLKEEKQFTLGDLMHFAKQVACGMEYLSSKKFLHRDLAARNCLVSDDYIVRIADFGLSKDLYVKDYYRRDKDSKTPLPLKWMAIESLRNNGEFTTQSDVWSYGVLVWELCTRGSQPYSDVNPFELRSYLERGYRLPKPQYAPDDIYTFMRTCWEEKPSNRPTFSEIHEYLCKLLANTQPSIYSDYRRVYTSQISESYVEDSAKDDLEIVAEEYLIPFSSLEDKKSDLQVNMENPAFIDA